MVYANSSKFEFADMKELEMNPVRDETQLASLLNKWASLNTISSLLTFACGILGLLVALG